VGLIGVIHIEELGLIDNIDYQHCLNKCCSFGHSPGRVGLMGFIGYIHIEKLGLMGLIEYIHIEKLGLMGFIGYIHIEKLGLMGFIGYIRIEKLGLIV
jgi:hypothetical protein